MTGSLNHQQNLELLQRSFPAEGFFSGKEWQLSTQPLALSPQTVDRLQRLGPILHRFLQTCELGYRRSRAGSLGPWIADYLDRGKPQALIDYGAGKQLTGKTTAVIRPDLLLLEDGLALVEIDTVPGGIGLTAWLAETFHRMGHAVLGGPTGMLQGMRSLAPQGADVVISQEAGDYLPEMRWLTHRLAGAGWSLHAAERYRPRGKPIYRFYELFDLPQIPFANRIIEEQAMVEVNPPMRAFLEEKMWLALFWSQPLRTWWQRELRASNDEFLRQVIPSSWIVDPRPLPPHGVIPGLGLHSFYELRELSQKQRKLVLKLSGYSELAWGSRSVVVGDDVSQREWAEAVNHALDSFPHHPYVLQRFRRSRVVAHRIWGNAGENEEIRKGRVRLCPYYFVDHESGAVQLGGVLATICPADKKILHGMRDATLVPCVQAEGGY